MNHHLLFPDLVERRIRFALTGANGAFARSLLMQARAIPSLVIAGLCDLDPERTRALLGSLGFPESSSRICVDEAAMKAAQAAGQIPLFRDHALLAAIDCDIVVEATGQPEVSVLIATAALRRRVHVAMVSKETDSVVGPWLNRLARENGVVYTTADGDQPSHLIGLVSWARLLGLDVVAGGKASEYDFVWDEAAGAILHTGSVHRCPEFAGCWKLGEDVTTQLQRRGALLAHIPQSAAADFCEVNVIANSTGLRPPPEARGHPLCRITELADVFIPAADGGILPEPGMVHVFNCLRRPDEASFSGGVFIIVRCRDEETWKVLRQKGHVISRKLQYALIYSPYNMMGVETAMSLFSAVIHGHASGSPTQKMHGMMAARAQRPFAAGEVLKMGGHHHSIEGASAVVLPSPKGGPAPYYLAANKRLRAPVACGELVTIDALELDGSALYPAWAEALRQED